MWRNRSFLRIWSHLLKKILNRKLHFLYSVIILLSIIKLVNSPWTQDINWTYTDFQAVDLHHAGQRLQLEIRVCHDSSMIRAYTNVSCYFFSVV